MSTLFKVGDRVRVYGTYNEVLEIVPGTVQEVFTDGRLFVESDYGIEHPGMRTVGWRCHVHEKQCRKLKPKAPRASYFVQMWVDLAAKKSDELDTLIATANAGQEALQELIKNHSQKFQTAWRQGVSVGASTGLYPLYERKPDPRVERIAKLEAELAKLKAEASK